MRRRALLVGVFLAAGIGVDGCLAPRIPIAPPGVDIAADSCDEVSCPAGGVVVHVTGLAYSGALVVATNVDRHFSDGRQYTVAGEATVSTTPPDGGAPSTGSYELVFDPMPDPAGGTVISQHGDHIVVYQLVRRSDGTYEASTSSQPVLVP